MDKDNKFDKKKYDDQYRKDHYTQCKLWIKPDDSEKITTYCKSIGISKNKFIIAAALYAMDNNIDLCDKSANSED